MTQAQLERAVCRVTGETRERVRRLGFQEVPTPKFIFVQRIPLNRKARQNHVVSGRG